MGGAAPLRCVLVVHIIVVPCNMSSLRTAAVDGGGPLSCGVGWRTTVRPWSTVTRAAAPALLAAAGAAVSV